MRGEMLIRPMIADDMPEVARLQDIGYAPSLRDSAEALRSRIDLAGHFCWIAVIDDVLIGYILAHPWPSGTPPVPDTILTQPDRDGLVHYIHDLSVDPRSRAGGIGRALVRASQVAALASGLTHSELVAIDGAGPYWRRQGYDDMPIDAALARKLRSYGGSARYLGRDLRAVDGQE